MRLIPIFRTDVVAATQPQTRMRTMPSPPPEIALECVRLNSDEQACQSYLCCVHLESYVKS